MDSFQIKDIDSGKRIDKILKSRYPKIPISALYKCFRKRDVKVNGKRVKENFIVESRDVVEIYLSDEVLEGSNSERFIFILEISGLFCGIISLPECFYWNIPPTGLWYLWNKKH